MFCCLSFILIGFQLKDSEHHRTDVESLSLSLFAEQVNAFFNTEQFKHNCFKLL